MQKKLAEDVFRVFDGRLRDTMPFFERESGDEIPKECRVYRWQGGVVTFFVQVQTHRREDSFTVEVAWSRNGSWPLAFNIDPVAPENPLPEEARFRLCRLWSDRDAWWHVKPHGFVARAVGRDTGVSAQVEDAIQRLLEYGLPYFRMVEASLETH